MGLDIIVYDGLTGKDYDVIMLYKIFEVTGKTKFIILS